MKLKTILFTALSFVITTAYAQSPITKITYKEEVYYITTQVEYPVIGEYKYESKGDPTVELNEGGKGRFQLHGMGKTPMNWGIECDENGVTKKEEGPGGARFILFYQITETNKGVGSGGQTWESGVVGKWDAVELTVSFADRKIDILRERFKPY